MSRPPNIIRPLAALLLAALALLCTPRPLLAAAPPTTSDVSPDQPDPATAKAAIDRAIAALFDTISHSQITNRVTVANLLTSTHTSDQFLQFLSQAEQLGAPRMVNSNTCQIELQISQKKVVAALKQIIANSASPLTPDQIDSAAQLWPDQFSAEGTVTSSTPSDISTGSISPQWDTIIDKSRQTLISQAAADAVQHVVDAVRPIPIASSTVGSLLDANNAALDLSSYLSNRPVARVRFNDDPMYVEVTLAVDASDLLTHVRASLHPSSPPTPADDAAWTAAQPLFTNAAPLAVGVAHVDNPPPAPTTVPAPTPSWVDAELVAEGRASNGDTKLKAARAAEADARAKLRTRVEALTLPNNITIAQAEAKDSRYSDAVLRSVESARLGPTTYAGLSARVSVTLELHDLWDALPR